MNKEYRPYLRKMSNEVLDTCVSDNLKLETLKQYLKNQIEEITIKEITITYPGSLKYLMFGPQNSAQSISIKMGKIGEKMVMKMVEMTPGFELGKCGVQNICGKKKYLDLVLIDKTNKKIYYREAKGNIELDSEKIVATINKINEFLEQHFKPIYPEYEIDIGVFNWGVYDRKIVKNSISHIRKVENKGIKVEHPKDLFKLLNFKWSEENYYKFFREMGDYLDETFFNNS